MACPAALRQPSEKIIEQLAEGRPKPGPPFGVDPKWAGLALPGRLAAGSEGLGDDLRGLPAGHIIARQEAGHAGGAGRAARVATEHPMLRRPLDIEPEWAAV